MQRKGRALFTDEFKREASQLAADLGSQKQAAKQLGVSEVNMHNWCKKYPANPRSGVKKTASVKSKLSPEASRIAELERENLTLRRVLAALTRDYLSK